MAEQVDYATRSSNLPDCPRGAISPAEGVAYGSESSENHVSSRHRHGKTMTQTNTESPAVRHLPHLELLHDFFRSHGVLFGEGENIRAFAARLALPGPFYEDMESMLRTIVFRENMGITRAELLDLLCVAVGGPRHDQAYPPLDAEVGQLLVFVNVVLLSLRKRTGEAGSEIGAAESAQSAPQPPTLPAPAAQSPAPMSPASDLATVKETEVAPGDHGQPLTPSPLLPGTDFPTRREEPRESYLATSHAQELTDSSPPRDPGSRDSVAVSGASSMPPQPDRLPLRSVDTLTSRRVLLSKPATVVAAAVLLLLATLMFVSWHRNPPSRTAQTVATPADGRTLGAEAQGPPSTSPEPSAAIDSGGALPSVPSTPSATSKLGKPAAGTPAGDDPVRGGIGGGNTVIATGSTAQISAGVAFPTQSARDEDVSSRHTNPASMQKSDRSGREEPARAHDAFSVQHSSRKGLFSVSSGVMGANLISAPEPEYPVLAKLTRIEGQVILQAVVSRRGTVVATHVLQGHHLLRGAAENCVKSWHYRPYLVNGRPTDVETIVFVNFQLHR